MPWTGDKLELFAEPLAFVVSQTTLIAMEGGKSQGRLVMQWGGLDSAEHMLAAGSAAEHRERSRSTGRIASSATP